MGDGKEERRKHNRRYASTSPEEQAARAKVHQMVCVRAVHREIIRSIVLTDAWSDGSFGGFYIDHTSGAPIGTVYVVSSGLVPFDPNAATFAGSTPFVPQGGDEGALLQWINDHRDTEGTKEEERVEGAEASAEGPAS